VHIEVDATTYLKAKKKTFERQNKQAIALKQYLALYRTHGVVTCENLSTNYTTTG
jgi:hypothetical protein